MIEDNLGLSRTLSETLCYFVLFLINSKENSLLILTVISTLAAYDIMTNDFSRSESKMDKQIFFVGIITQLVISFFYSGEFIIKIRTQEYK
jgi:ABC-type phosphate transport system permease subunit